MLDYDKFILNTKKLSILLVEDYKPLRDEIAQILEEFFSSIEVASNGEEALSIYKNSINQSRCFDIVISDIEMPIVDGVELAHQIYQINPKQHIIILSSHTDTQYLLQFINLGISQFITKPINYDMFMSALYKISNKIVKEEADGITKHIVSLSNGYMWDKKNHILKKDNTIVSLTKSETLFIAIMFIRFDSICTNRDIIDYFYSENISINESSIRNLAFKVRKKLPNNTIETIYAMGYKLNI